MTLLACPLCQTVERILAPPGLCFSKVFRSLLRACGRAAHSWDFVPRMSCSTVLSEIGWLENVGGDAGREHFPVPFTMIFLRDGASILSPQHVADTLLDNLESLKVAPRRHTRSFRFLSWASEFHEPPRTRWEATAPTLHRLTDGERNFS